MTTYEQLESREYELIAIINGDPTEEQYHRAMRELAEVQVAMLDEWMKQ